MSPVKKRFLAALALYLLWVGVMATLVVVSSEPPRAKGTAAAAEGP